MKKILIIILFSIQASAILTEVDKANINRKNLLLNPGEEQGKVGWTASGGTYIRTTSPGNVGEGNSAISWDSSAAAQTLTSSSTALPFGWANAKGIASCLVQTPSGASSHTIEAFNASSGTTIGTATIITSSTDYVRAANYFKYPSPGGSSVALRFKSVASNEPNINIDGCTLGLTTQGHANVYTASQASEGMHLLTAKISGPGGGSCQVSDEDGDWIDGTPASPSTGQCVVRTQPGIFRGYLNCGCTAVDSSNSKTCTFTQAPGNANQIVIRTYDDAGSAAGATGGVLLWCIGPR